MAVIAIVTLIFLFMIFALALVNCKTSVDIEDSDKEQMEYLRKYSLKNKAKKEGNNIDKTV
mgnify:FL=1